MMLFLSLMNWSHHRELLRILEPGSIRFPPNWKENESLLYRRPKKWVFCGFFDRFSAGYFSPFLLYSGETGDDLLSSLFEHYCDWASGLRTPVFQFLVRATLVLGISSLCCWLA